MGCTAGAPASIHPSKAPCSLRKRPRDLTRSQLQVDSHRKRSGRSQQPAFSSKPRVSRVWFSYTRFRHSLDSSTTELLSILAEPGAYSPNSTWNNTFSCVAVPYELFAIVSSASRLSRASEGRHIGDQERRTWRKRPGTTKLPPPANEPVELNGQPVGVTSRG